MIIGKLAVALSAKTTGFTKGMTGATKSLDSFARSASKYGLMMQAAGTAMLAPIVGAVRSFTRYGDKIAKMARRTGLAVDTLSRLGYMAEISGSDVDDLEKGIRRMAKAITDANYGMTTYVRAFELIGVDRAERQYDKDNALCCGMTIRATQRDDLADDVQKRNLDDMESVGAKYCVFNCPACFFAMREMVAERKMIPILMSDLCQMALDE